MCPLIPVGGRLQYFYHQFYHQLENCTFFSGHQKNRDLRPIINQRTLNRYMVKKAFQNGHIDKSAKLSEQERLGNLSRS